MGIAAFLSNVVGRKLSEHKVPVQESCKLKIPLFIKDCPSPLRHTMAKGFKRKCV